MSFPPLYLVRVEVSFTAIYGDPIHDDNLDQIRQRYLFMSYLLFRSRVSVWKSSRTGILNILSGTPLT